MVEVVEPVVEVEEPVVELGVQEAVDYHLSQEVIARRTQAQSEGGVGKAVVEQQGMVGPEGGLQMDGQDDVRIRPTPTTLQRHPRRKAATRCTKAPQSKLCGAAAREEGTD